MARLSRAKGGETTRARQQKASVNRAAERDQASEAAVAATRPEPPQPPAPEPVAMTVAPAVPASPPPPDVAASAAASPPQPVAERPEPASPVSAAGAEPEPLTEMPVPEVGAGLRPALAIPGQAPDLAAILGASRTLVEGSLRTRSQMIGFTCRQAEHGLAASRAMLASGSVPEALALQAKYLGKALDDALAQTLELSRLSSELMRAGLRSLRPH